MEIDFDPLAFRGRAVNFPAAAVFLHEADGPAFIGELFGQRLLGQPFTLGDVFVGIAAGGIRSGGGKSNH